MAFMMPVVKKDYDIYRSGRSRRSSECSSGAASCRSRKVSECSKSEGPSLSTSPGGGGELRGAARSSQASLQSPSKSSSSSSSSSSSLNKFHTRLVDRLKRSLNCGDSSAENAKRAS